MDHSLVPNHENPDDARVTGENVPDDNRQAAASRNGRGNAYISQQKKNCLPTSGAGANYLRVGPPRPAAGMFSRTGSRAPSKMHLAVGTVF